MNAIFEGARILLTVSFLLYASWSDWKQREVSNKVWILFAPLAFALTITQFALYPQSFPLYPPLWSNLSSTMSTMLFYALSFAVTSAMSIALFYAGAFGGADAKALMCLALALPYPVYLVPSVSLFLPIFPFTVFSNSVLLAALTAVYALIRNSFWRLRNKTGFFVGLESESVWRKITALVTAYKAEPAALERNPHIYPLEDVTVNETGGEGKRVLLTFPKDEGREAIVARLVSAGKNGRIRNGVWVTPGLPLLIFITAGLIIALFVGDLVWILLGLVLVPR